jgi:hypothetical protein
MEMVAYLAGEPHSDHPQCACPVIAAFVRRLNDAMPNAERDRLLLPVVPKLVGTRSTQDVELRRGYLAADFAVRVAAPAALRAAALRAAGLDDAARALESLPEVVDQDTALAAKAAARAAAEDAWTVAADWAATRAATAATRAADWAASKATARAAADAADAAEAAEAADWGADTAISAGVHEGALKLIERMIAAGAGKA